MKISTLLAGAALAAGLAATAQATELKLGHVAKPGSLIGATADHFAECANKALPSDYDVKVYGSSQLGNDKEMLQKLKLGQLTFSVPSSVMSSVDDRFGVFEMPYIVKDRDQMRRIQDTMWDDVFQQAAADHGYQIVGLWENGFRQITNNIRPINKPEDLEGIKLRTPNGAWRVKMFKLYGANPTPMAFSDVFTALKTGVIDGQENPLAQIASAKFQEVQKYLSMTGHVYTPAYLLVSKSHFSSLPENVQKVLNDCGSETQDFAYKTGAQMDQDLLKQLKDGGMEVNDADKDAFIKASKPIYDEYADSVDGGRELIDRVLATQQGS